MEKLERELLLEREGVVYERVLREELFIVFRLVDVLEPRL